MRRFAGLCALLLLAGAARAQESPIPRLGNHLFVPATTIPEPFLTTHVQTLVSLGRSVRTTIRAIDLPDTMASATTRNEQFLTAIGFTYQQAAKEWLAVGFSLSAGGRMGTGINTLLVDGITGFVGYDLSWKLRIYRSRSLLLSGSIGLGNNDATFINLLDWAGGLLEGEDASLVRSRNSLFGLGGLHASWGLGRRFGLLGSVAVDYGESFDGRGGNSWHADERLALSYDLMPDLRVPLGLLIAGGHYENQEDADIDQGVWFWSARIASQSRANFSIGLDLMTSYYDSRSQDVSQQFSQINISMRYFY